MKSLVGLLFLPLFCLSCFGQSRTEDNHIFDVEIVMSKEYFKISDSAHRELFRLYSQGSVFSLENNGYGSNGEELEKFQIAPFEVHIQADSLGNFHVAEARAAVGRYLYVDAPDAGIGFTTDNRAGDFDYKNFGLNEAPGKQLKILDITFAESKTGIRYTSKDGKSYVAIGGLVGFGLSSSLKKSAKDLGSDLDSLEPNQWRGDVTEKSGANYQLKYGGFGELNLKDKVKISGSLYWTTNAKKSEWNYETYSSEEVFIPAYATFNGIEETVMMTRTHYREISVWTNRQQLQLKAEADLGKLISPMFTGLSLNSGLDVDRYRIQYDGTESATRFRGNYYDEKIDFANDQVVQNFNQVRFNVGLKINISEIQQREKKATKFRAMMDLD